MSKNNRQRMKKLQKTRAVKLQRPEDQVKAAAKWPVTSCLISNHWQQAGHLIEIMITRTKEADGLRKHVVGMFLIDPGCLGLKSTFARPMTPEDRDGIVSQMSSHCGGCSEQPVERAAMIVQAAVEYARSCGFEPDPDYRVSRHMLADIEPADELDQLTLGDGEGKPLYVPGPDSDVAKDLAKLEQKFGAEGYAYGGGH